ncbi:C-type lectin domain family 7 member A-like isoform X1 [Monodelphis domestica]|uniref:C-type lectin domain family 7 member A-like isoform X1 n=1 Tax=Monodelphis domestica TaxID=13616 RepID=UPI0024E1AA15|nr:C-type lectin domain family 7 member A-like isoform X1 [Monodelphis domestica]
MEESSIMNTFSIHDQKESEPPTTAQETTEQEVTTLVCPSSLPLTAAPDEEWAPIPNDIFFKDDTTTSAPWGLVAVILGILSLLLMITSIFFGYQYLQNIKQSPSQVDGFTKELESFHNKVENFTGQLKKMQEDILRDLKIRIEDLFDILRTRKINQGNYSEPCLKHWKEYKDKCYNETLKIGSWSNCSDLCNSMNFTFLQSGNHMLMEFLMTFTLNDIWISVSYEQDSKEWKWRSGSYYPFLKSPKPEQDLKELCVYIKLNPMGSYPCDETLSCMCEKKTFGAEN